MSLHTKFIKIPIKRSKFVKIYQSLKYQILTCKELEVSEYISGIEMIDSLRHSLTDILINFESLENLYKYHDLIYYLTQSLPNSILNQKIENLIWKSAIPEKTKILVDNKKPTTLEYELCAVLYCIAAVQSSIACSANFGNQDELKQSTILFQKSAGIFEFLADVVETRLGKRITDDMSPSVLSAYSAICILHAHCCVYEKANSPNSSKDILSKIASEGATLAQKAVDLSAAAKLPNESISFLQNCLMYFKAQTHYFKSFTDEANGHYGLRVARLRIAAKLSNQTKFLDENLYNECFSKSKKENDFIYHNVEPPEVDIPPVPTASIVKMISPVFPFTELPNPFYDISSPAVLQAIESFNHLWDSFVLSFVERMSGKSGDYDKTLKKFYLPAILETNQNQIPDYVLKIAEKVRSAGSISKIEENVSKIDEKRQHCLTLIHQCTEALNREQAFDNKQRLTYRQYWTPMDSANLTSTLWSQLKTIEARVVTANEVDKTIWNMLLQCKDAILILEMSDLEIEEQIPNFSTANQTKNDNVVSRLGGLMDMAEEQQQSLKLMCQILKNADFSTIVPKFKERDRQNHPLKVDDEYKLLKDSYAEQIDDIFTAFGSIIIEINNICQDNGFAVSSGDSSTPSKNSREEYLNYLSSGFEKFQKVLFHISEGLGFYSTITNYLERLDSNVMDYCYSRSLEANQLLEALHNQSYGSRTNPPYPH